MLEIWKDVPGYEGLYQVSNLGNVKSLNYNKTGNEKILKQKIRKNTNYLVVCLCKKGLHKDKFVHRLVLEAFNPNKNDTKSFKDEIINYDKLVVNHIDENKHNNCINNLEWCTHRYNDNYGSRREKLRNSHLGMSYKKHTKSIL